MPIAPCARLSSVLSSLEAVRNGGGGGSRCKVAATESPVGRVDARSAVIETFVKPFRGSLSVGGGRLPTGRALS